MKKGWKKSAKKKRGKEEKKKTICEGQGHQWEH